jgi:hypothetical protein
MSNPADPINNLIDTPIPNNSIVHGIINNQYVRGVTTTSWNARSGGLSKITFKGTEDQLIILAQLAKDGGYEYSLTGGHIWTLEITFPFDVVLDPFAEEDPLFTWEMINAPFEKDILELGDRPFTSNLSTDTVKAIEFKLKNPDSGVLPFTPADAKNGDAAVNAQVAYNLKSIGVHGKQSSLQTLRRTIIVSNFFETQIIAPQFDYKLFTTTQFDQQYNSDVNPLNNMPVPMRLALPEYLDVSSWSNGTTTILNKDAWNMDSKGIVTYIGWLQFPAEYQMVSVNKVQITQNWTFNQWSAGSWGLYDPISSSGPSPNPNDVLKLKP